MGFDHFFLYQGWLVIMLIARYYGCPTASKGCCCHFTLWSTNET